MRIITALGFILLSLATLPLCAGAAGKDRGGQPIVIKSNELQADTKNRTAIFLGKVVAKQADFTMHADRVVVYYGAQGGDVEKVEAFGTVRIVQENRIGTAQHAVYYNREGRITLSGSPRVVQGKDSVSGREITYYLNEEKSVVTGSPESRVEAVIYPKGKAQDGAGKP
jgi:lipopolysaccharide export system protein LptA